MMGYLHTLLVWFALIQLIGLATLPLAWKVFGNLPDRGYNFSKTLGVLLTGTGVWLFSVYGSVGIGAGPVWIVIFLLGAVSWLPILRRTSGTGLLRRLLRRKSGPHLRTSEAVFLFSFLFMAILRLHSPAANHTEQPMDLMLNTAVAQATEVPPEDPWLAGYPVSYYYFGYWMQGCLARATGVPPEITYNMGLITWFSLLVIGVYGVAYNLMRSRGSGRKGAALARRTGLATALAVAVFGNLYSFVEWIYALGLFPEAAARALRVPGFPEQADVTGNWFVGSDWWWWRSSRIFEDLNLQGKHIEVIAEFPMFSYVLGDNHPHLLAMPFAVLVIALSMNLLYSGKAPNIRAAFWSSTGEAAVLGITIGALGFINSWNFPAFFLIPLGAWLLMNRASGDGGLAQVRSLLALGGSILFFALLCFWPHLLSAQSQVKGFAPNIFYPTRLIPFLLMFGPWLAGLLAYLWLLHSRHKKGLGRLAGWGAVGIAGVLLVQAIGWLYVIGTGVGRRSYPNVAESLQIEQLSLGLSRWLQSPLVLIGLGVLAGVVFWFLLRLSQGQLDLARKADLFILLMALSGILLLLVPELVYVRDSFESRMNTVFKFYYQGWLLLGLGASAGSIRALRGDSQGPRVLAVFSLLLIGLGVFFPATAGYGKSLSSGKLTLDALAYLRESQADEYEAIEWIRRNTPPESVVLQAVGESYRPETSRISMATGRPTLLGWAGHERQWRGSAFGEMAGGREDAVRTIYSSRDPAQVSRLLQTWHVDYVFLGPVESRKYPIDNEEQRGIRRLLDPVFSRGEYGIYRWKE